MWTDQHGDQFEDLKKALTSTPVLATLDADADFILRTDVSDTAIGGVLAQRQLFEGRVVECPLGYFSRKLHAARQDIQPMTENSKQSAQIWTIGLAMSMGVNGLPFTLTMRYYNTYWGRIN